jgi:hypothetical protein
MMKKTIETGRGYYGTVGSQAVASKHPLTSNFGERVLAGDLYELA